MFVQEAAQLSSTDGERLMESLMGVGIRTSRGDQQHILLGGASISYYDTQQRPLRGTEQRYPLTIPPRNQ